MAAQCVCIKFLVWQSSYVRNLNEHVCPPCEDPNSKQSYSQLCKKQTSSYSLVLLAKYLPAGLQLVHFLSTGMRGGVLHQGVSKHHIQPLCLHVSIPFLAASCFWFPGWSNANADFPSLQVESREPWAKGWSFPLCPVSAGLVTYVLFYLIWI